MQSRNAILVTGATGYVGGRLVPRLIEAGHRVRCLVRDPSRLQGRAWASQVEVVQGDVLDPDSLGGTMRDVDVVYYLIHSLGEGGGFQQLDVQAARNTSAAAKSAGVNRLIYLGGLGDSRADLSPHLRSRQQAGEALRQSGVSVTEFRAAIVVGSGSLSFEMVRYLTERLPVMICPKWVFTRIQPIAIRNVLDYLVGAIQSPASADHIIEIGGLDVLTYAEMMTRYARVRGLKRLLIAVPVLTPRLSSYWVHLITPIPANIAQPLIKGLTNEVVVHDDTARRLFPSIQLLDYETSVPTRFRKNKTPRSGDLLDRCPDLKPSREGTRRAPHQGRADHRAPSAHSGCSSRGCLSRLRQAGRTKRMALPGLDVESARTGRSTLWRSRYETRTARFRGRARRRRARFLACGSC